MFQFPGFAFIPYVFRNKYLHCDIRKSETNLRPKHSTGKSSSELRISKVGFPIRKSADQSLFAAPHGLSQRTTSFIASQRQGIHRIPLLHLIALIIDIHRSAACHRLMTNQLGDTIVLKTSLLQMHPGTVRSCSVHDWCPSRRLRAAYGQMHFLFTMSDTTSAWHEPNGRIHFGRTSARSRVWWSQTGSNRRPHACKARALPTELWPRASSANRRPQDRPSNGGPGKT